MLQSDHPFPAESQNHLHDAFSGAAQRWLKTLPAVEDHIDLYALNDDDFAVKSIRALLENKPFELNVATGHHAGAWFNHFYFESRNREKIFGAKNLGIGYPLLLGQVGDMKVSAPLFVWSFQLEPHAQHADHWLAQKNQQQGVRPNFPLFHLLDSHFGTFFTTQVQTMVDKNQFDNAALTDLCQRIGQHTGYREEGLPMSVQPCPTDANLDILQRQGTLLWSAMAGIYPSLPRTFANPITEARSLPANLDWKHNFTLLPLDPSQRSVLQSMQRNTFMSIEGASGSGKTYLISALAMNALSNGKKCLIVSQNLNALRRAQKFLLDKGFGDVSFIVRDLESDQLMLSDMLRMAADSKNKTGHDEELFKTTLNKVSREQRKLDDAWDELHQPLFGEKSFAQTVGQFLRANRTEGKEMLLSQLNPADLELNKEEFDTITTAIRGSEPLFRHFPTLNHPLGKLRHAIFLENTVEKGQEWTDFQLRFLSEKAASLYHRYISKTNDYTEALLDNYEQYYEDLAAYIKRLRDSIEDGVQRFGPDFEKPASTTEKLYGVFSDRFKHIVASKEKIAATFDEMRRTYNVRKYFEFDFPPNFDSRNIKKIAEITKDFEASLRLWRRRIPTVVRDDVRRLNASSIHADLDFSEQIKDLEYSMDVLLEEFNAAGLYEESFKHEMLTIPKRQEYLEDMIAKLEETRFYLRDFADFYIWQKHWLGLSAVEQKVVRALCKVKPRNWTAAFESWYLHHLLQKEYNPGLLWNEENLGHFAEYTNELRRLMPAQISTLWHQRKTKALKALKSEDSNAFKTWFGKNNRSLMGDQKAGVLFRKHFEPLTETLPVLLVTPQVALDVMNASEVQFDLVLVDEAHNIPKQEGFHLMGMGKHVLVFGDPKQDMTPFEQDDLFEYCQGAGAQNFKLEYQHQDAPEEWLAFNQIAFGAPAKRIPGSRTAREATTVINVEGRYDEYAGTNEAEARQIIDWLNLIEPTPAKTYPVVGIACATVQQRDLIAGQLLRIRQRRSPGHEKIQQLLLNGLGIYQFAELQGQHVDILLVSLTHGLVDAQGSLTKHMHFWNSQLGFNQMNVVLTRATQKLFIAHSIPPGLHTVLAADKTFIGTCTLSHLVSFAEMVQRGDQEQAQEQLRNMAMLLQYHEPREASNAFMDEVEVALRPFFEPGQLRRFETIAGIRVPLLVESSANRNTQRSILMFDGVLSQTLLPSYEWEEKLKQFFTKNQVQAVSVLSAQWWRSPRQEARKLAARLIRHGEEVETVAEEIVEPGEI